MNANYVGPRGRSPHCFGSRGHPAKCPPIICTWNSQNCLFAHFYVLKCVSLYQYHKNEEECEWLGLYPDPTGAVVCSPRPSTQLGRGESTTCMLQSPLVPEMDKPVNIFRSFAVCRKVLATLDARWRQYCSRDISALSAIQMLCIILRYINFWFFSILFYGHEIVALPFMNLTRYIL